MKKLLLPLNGYWYISFILVETMTVYNLEIITSFVLLLLYEIFKYLGFALTNNYLRVYTVFIWDDPIQIRIHDLRSLTSWFIKDTGEFLFRWDDSIGSCNAP